MFFTPSFTVNSNIEKILMLSLFSLVEPTNENVILIADMNI